jgi:sirohydrochlorin ferrochelatase
VSFVDHIAGHVSLVLAAHGDRGADRSNAWLHAHRQALAAGGAFAHVGAGFLKGEPMIEDALRQAAAESAAPVLVYPLFISDGYFMGVLRGRIAALGLEPAPRLLAPFGEDARLPALMMTRALEAAQAAGFAPEATRLLVIGHGSQVSPANALATRAMIATLASMGRFARVEAGFIEEPPLVADAVAADKGPTVVVGYLTGEGMHAQADVPRAIAASGGRAVYAGAIGVDDSVREMILAAALPPATGG